MKRKTLSLIAGAALLFATAVPAASMPVWAAKGGAVRMAAPKSAPLAPAKTTPNGSGTNSQSTLNQNAKTQQQARPNTNTTAQTQSRANTAQSSSRWGSAMRNIGLLAGGMFLGSMLSSLFGWGSMGWMADILGVLFNIILVLVIISLISRLWRKFRGRKGSREDDAYRRGYEAAMRSKHGKDGYTTIDVTPLDKDTHTKR